MNLLKINPINFALLIFSIIGSANANTVLYEIGGNAVGGALPITGDPIADLLNIPRNENSNIPFNVKLTIDRSSTPFVINDNSIGQEVVYSDAIINVEVNLNGVQFQTLQPLQRIPKQGSGITIVNTVSSPGLDFFKIQPNELFNSVTVPFNQTINGSFHETADVFLSNLIVIVSASDLLDGIEIPTENDVFDSVSLAINFQLGTDIGGFSQLSGNSLTFNITNLTSPSTDRVRSIRSLFNWAQTNYSELFALPYATIQRLESWTYVHYQQTNTYIGVNENDEVWVLGDVFGGLVYIDSLDNLLDMIGFENAKRTNGVKLD